MKKIALLLAVVMLGLIFVGCDVSEESSAPAESNGTGETSPEISRMSVNHRHSQWRCLRSCRIL